MKKLIKYGERLCEIKTISKKEDHKAPVKPDIDTSKLTKAASKSFIKTMKLNKEIFYANTSDYIDDGLVFFATFISDELTTLNKKEFDRRIKVFLQRIRRAIPEQKHMLVKEYGQHRGYHFHFYIWGDSLDKNAIAECWDFGSSLIERVETLCDMKRVANYCFNYSNKYNPASYDKIQRKLKGLEHFGFYESMVKKSKGLKLPKTEYVPDTFMLTPEYFVISSSSRLISEDDLWQSKYYERQLAKAL